MTIQVIDFFSGCGGTSWGFQNAGLTILAGLDNDADAAETYRINFPNAKFLEEDVKKIDPSILNDIVGDRSHPLLFAGCAPCQPFSRQNKTSQQDDPRRTLLNDFGRFIEAWRPEYIFVENVPGIQKIKKGSPLEGFLSLLKQLEYLYQYQVVSASSYGVPQTRKRLVLIASRYTPIQIPAPTHGLGTDKKLSTVKDWISDLPAIKAGEIDNNDEDHAAAKLNALNLKRIKNTPEGGSRNSWPEKLWLNCHKDYKGHSDVYGRLAWDKPASGLTTRCISYSNGRFGHPDQHRAISAREAACLQTFPRNYKFHGSLISKARQIGNAVPPKMSEVFGRAFIKHNSLMCGNINNENS